jgi:hypothetical protein
MIQQFTFDGTGRQIDARGVTFRYESGTDTGGVTDLKLWIDGNAVGTLSPGDLLELPEAGKRWEIKPVSSTCLGIVKIGMAKISTSKVAGVVSTIDGGKIRSITGGAFSSYVYQAPTASFWAQVQLWNKSTTHNLIVSRFNVISTSASNPHLFDSSVPLANLNGVGKNKLLGGAVSARAEMRSGTVGSAPNSANAIWAWAAGGAYCLDYKSAEPVVVPPGRGAIVYGFTQGADIGASFEWFEDPV